MEVISGTDKKVDLHIFNYIIKQKDIIISELNGKIKLLNTQIELMNKYQASNLVKETVQKTETIKVNENAKKFVAKNNTSEDSCSTMTKSDNPTGNKPKNTPVTRKDLSAGLLQVESQAKLGKYINLAKNDSPPPSSTKEERWQQVPIRRRRRPGIIGSNKELAVQGVPKYAILHVYRVDPKMTAVDLTEQLKHDLPEIICEGITPKYPGLYSSYKVSIYETNFKKAMNPSIWPFGACISRFLQMGNKREEPKE